jgi:glycosyltransferase involved in cell wall biosynthesis/SAM-dependent methyltransferase
MHACTIVARNYLPHARVVAHTFLEHNPGGRFTVLLIDDRDRATSSDGPFEILHLDELITDPAELHLLAMYYDVMELATAVKPLLLMRLRRRGEPVVVYLDPDIEVYGELVDVAALAEQAPIVLTPHSTVPFPRDGLRPTEAEILASGVYNLGFIGVSAGSDRFLRWWWERLQRDAVVDPTRMLFTDQRWVDFAPSMFDHALLKDPGYNVAYWNVHGRKVTREGDRLLVNGQPLRFFHFSGYSPFRPDVLSKHQGDHPRLRLHEMPVVAELCAAYGANLIGAGLSEAGPAYGWSRLADGTPVDQPMRLAYRLGVQQAEAAGIARRPLPPDPFDPSTVGELVNWLRQPTPGRRWSSTNRYLQALYDAREDLQLTFPESSDDAEAKFTEWARKSATPPDPRLLEPVGRAVPGRPRTGLPAVEVVGYFRAELGVGEAGRQLVAAVQAAGAPVTTRTWDETLNRQDHPFEELDAGVAPGVNLLCFNADRVPLFAELVGADYFQDRYTIGAWAWELEEFPTGHDAAFATVDEVWANSEYARRAIAQRTSKPVVAVPPPVTAPVISPEISRASLGLPDGFVFFFAFDYLSVFARKNPLGLIAAFSQAFPPGSGASLVIKTINGERDRASERALRAAAGEHREVHLLEGYVSAAERDALMALSDCYVSLHRSEGFGLTLAESMALGKPVIATAYSGNLDFMDEQNSYLVPYARRAVGTGAEPYAPDAVWAEPDVDAAARLMRHVVESPEEATARGARAAADIRAKHSPQARAALVKERLEQAGRSLAPRDDDRPVPAAPTLQLGALDRRVRRVRFLLHVAKTPEMRRAALRRRAGNLVSAGFGQSRRAIAEQEATRREVTTLRRTVEQLATEIDVVAETVNGGGLADEADQRSREAITRLDTAFDEIHSTKSVAEHVRDRVDELAGRLDALTGDVRQVEDELLAPPYVSDPEALVVQDGTRTTLGYGPGARQPADYASFEQLFRGEQEFIRDRQRVYLDLLRDRGPVLDVGCGRGEMLSLLAEAGVPSRGLDLDPSMVAEAVQQGLDVTQEDALAALEAAEPGSLGAVVSFQVIEHLALDDLRRFVELAHRALRPDGVLVAETVNPHSPRALRSFWLDITHRHPIFPEAALMLASGAGFPAAHILFPHGSGELAEDRVRQGEYALVAHRTA